MLKFFNRKKSLSLHDQISDLTAKNREQQIKIQEISARTRFHLLESRIKNYAAITTRIKKDSPDWKAQTFYLQTNVSERLNDVLRREGIEKQLFLEAIITSVISEQKSLKNIVHQAFAKGYIKTLTTFRKAANDKA